MDTTARTRMAGLRGFPVLRDVPVILAFLGAGLVAAVDGVDGRIEWRTFWVSLHLLVLLGASHAILVWSRYFAETLLRLPSTIRAHRQHLSLLVTFDIASLLVIVGVGRGWHGAVWCGAALIIGVAGFHAVWLARGVRRAIASRFASAIRFYIAAAALLPVGVVIGVVMAGADSRSLLAADPAEIHERQLLAHLLANVLGWIGLVVLGTVVAFWPTVLRTRIAVGAERRSRVALWLLLAGLLLAGIAVVVPVRPLFGPALVLYWAGAVVIGLDLVRVARVKAPTSLPAASIGSAFLWFVGLFAVAIVHVLRADSWTAATESVLQGVMALAVGFVAQIIVGALTYLVPVLLGGGPAAVRGHIAALERWTLPRVLLTNVGVVLMLVPDARALGIGLAALGLGSAVPLLVVALLRWRT